MDLPFCLFVYITCKHVVLFHFVYFQQLVLFWFGCLFGIKKCDKYFGYFILVAGPFKCLFVCLFVLVLFFF